MSQPGWYPDPAGQPGMLRYWDGQNWGSGVSPATGAAPTPAGSMPSFSPPPAYFSGYSPATPPPTVPGPPTAFVPPPPKRNRPVLVGIIVLVVALALGFLTWGIVALVNRPQESPATPNPPVTQTPTQTPPPTLAPTAPTNPTASPTETGGVGSPAGACAPLPEGAQAYDSSDGRVHAGGLSYPMMGDPWTCPQYFEQDFSADAVIQTFELPEPNYPDGWMANIVIGTLDTTGQTFTPQSAAEALLNYIAGNWYSDQSATAQNVSSQAVTISGVTGWKISAAMHYSVQGVDSTYDQLTIVVLPTSAGIGVMAASVPNTTPSPQQDQIQAAIAGLTVG